MEKIANNKLLDLSGKTAIVTGAAMGIGLGIATRLAEAGANIVIADVNSTAGEESATKLKQNGWEVIFVKTDVSQELDIQKMIGETEKNFGSVDILVNNAGIFPNVPVMQMTEQDFEKVIHVNLKSAFLCTKYASEQMIKQGRGGKVINITSIDALHPSAVGLAIYDASKHGMWGFTKNVALELAPHKIWVNAIAPGSINTPGASAFSNNPEGEKLRAAFNQKIPMKRSGEADEIGKVALFLSSDMASYITGSQIVVDGGILLS